MHGRDELEQALTLLGHVLRARGQHYTVALIGGGALLLAGLGTRPTRDIDAVGIVDGEQVRSAEPAPPGLAEAVIEVAAELDLDPRWFNAGSTALLDAGLPDGFLQRAERRDYGGLVALLASRLDQIHLKLYVCVDQGPRSKHAADLLLLTPALDELNAAAAWCRQQDPSPAFAGQLEQALTFLAAELSRDPR